MRTFDEVHALSAEDRTFLADVKGLVRGFLPDVLCIVMGDYKEHYTCAGYARAPKVILSIADRSAVQVGPQRKVFLCHEDLYGCR